MKQLFLAAAACALAACGGTGGAAAQATAPSATVSPSTGSPGAGAACAARTTPAPAATPAGPAPQPATGLSVPSGFQIEIIGNVPRARELTFLSNGDLLVGTMGSSVYLIANPEGQAAYPQVFADVGDSPAAGVTFASQNCTIYIGAQFGVYAIAYTFGDRTARSGPIKIASVRSGGGSGHSTTSVAVSGDTLYASVGSSCNACTETDPTRASIQQMALTGAGMHAKAVHIRNAIALTVNPATATLWAGDAGQDDLPAGHPYEFFDAVTLHAGTANYGWPECEENRVAYTPGADCTGVVVPLVVFPAYQTIVGAAFYPGSSGAPYAFPQHYLGGAFVSMHGSWHTGGAGVPIAPPRVAYVPMSGDAPVSAVNWSDPTRQWSDFITGFQRPNGTRIGRPSGVAVGPLGDVFVADDQTGSIYRIRH